MKSLLHIGMPKCMSTSIQAYLRDAAGTYFMGIGPSRYVREEVMHAFQRQLLRTPALFYDSAAVAEVFDRSISEAAAEGANLFALSDESIPFLVGCARAEVSYIERLLRLKEVMPQGTGVLMIVRRPEDYLKSSYKYRTVMNGLRFTFDEYLRRLILLGDTYVLGTAKYFHYAQAARQIFGDVKVIAMEEIEDDPGCLPSYFRDLGAGGPDELPRENPGFPSDRLGHFRDTLAAYGDVFADDDFNVLASGDRLICRDTHPYFASALATALAKEKNLENLRQFAMQLPGHSDPATFRIADETRKFLTDYVAPSNAQLKRQFGVATDEYDYDLF